MPGLLTYLALFRTQTLAQTQFRANWFAGALFTPVKICIIYVVWKFIIRESGQLNGMGFDDILVYYVVVHFLARFYDPFETINYSVWEDINQGKLDIYLARPIGYAGFLFTRTLATPCLDLIFALPFFSAFFLILRLPFQSQPVLLLLFVLSLLLGVATLFLIQFAMGCMTFWFERIFGIRDMLTSVIMLFSGQLIPIQLLPGPLRNLSAYMPFECIFANPVNVFKSTSLGECGPFLLRQVIWVALLGLAATFMWRRGLARYDSQGG